MANSTQQIVIVGGGMVGVSLALLLSQQLQHHPQIRLTLVERFALPAAGAQPQYQASFDERSTVLSAGSIDILKKMGCWSHLSSHAEAIDRVHVSDRGHFGGVQLDAEDYAVEALGAVLENRWLGQVLLAQVQQSDITLLAPATVAQCQPKKQGYRVSVQYQDATQEIDADLLLIADGADSPLRQSLGIDVRIDDYQQSALIANVTLAKPHNNIAYERFTDEGPIALLPLKPHQQVQRAALVWTLPSARAEQLQQADKADILQQLQQGFGFRAGRIIDIGQRQIFPLKLVEAQEQVRSHLAVIGNAAHFLHPVAGQGFNLALRDCAALTQCLGQAASTDQALGQYQVLNAFYEAQQGDQQAAIGITHSLIKLFSSQRVSLAALRQLGFLSLVSLPLFKRRFAQQMMGMPQ